MKQILRSSDAYHCVVKILDLSRKQRNMFCPRYCSLYTMIEGVFDYAIGQYDRILLTSQGHRIKMENGLKLCKPCPISNSKSCF